MVPARIIIDIVFYNNQNFRKNPEKNASLRNEIGFDDIHRRADGTICTDVNRFARVFVRRERAREVEDEQRLCGIVDDLAVPRNDRNLMMTGCRDDEPVGWIAM